MNAKNIYPGLILWFFTALAVGWATDFPSRPTVAEMETAVTTGTVCGAAVRERTLAVNNGQTFLPYCGFRQPYVASLQQTLEGLAPQYVDDVNGPFTAAGTNFLYFTLTSWRGVAGLNTSGFRRYDQNRNLTGYGIAQADDVMVTAVYDELVAGYKALQWTSLNAGWTSPDNNRFGTSSTSYVGVAAAWSGTSWRTEGYGYGMAAAWVDNYGSGPWTVEKVRGQAQFTAPAFAAYIGWVQLYGVVEKFPEGDPREFLSFEAPGTEGQRLTLDEIDGPLTPSTTYYDSHEYGNSSVIVPDPGAISYGTIRGWNVRPLGLIKWDFTNP